VNNVSSVSATDTGSYVCRGCGAFESTKLLVRFKGMGLILPRVFLAVALGLRLLHKKTIPMTTRAKRTRALRAINPSTAGRYFPTLSNVFSRLSGSVTDVEVLEAFAALYVMLLWGTPPRRL
jgi:hypothetical protein